MSDGTEIVWTDATLNIVSGCTKVSPGCEHCYIDRTPPFRIAHRKFDRPEIGGTTGVQLHRERLSQPYRWRKPRRIFVCSLADLFHDDVPDDLIVDLWAVMATTPRHTYQILTKRPARMRAILSAPDFREKVARSTGHRMDDGDNWADYVMCESTAWPLPNVWVGVTAEDQHRADQRIPILLRTPAAVRWVSAEPLLGPLAVGNWLGYPRGVDWIVCGGESGPQARPMHPDWARSLRDQCWANDVPFLFKQWGSWGSRDDCPAVASTGVWLYPDGSTTLGTLSSPARAREVGEPAAMFPMSVKVAGRHLDRRLHDGYPT